MKTRIAAALLLVASSTHAWESDHSKNPDQRGSVALNFANGYLSGGGVNTEYLYSKNKNTNVPVEDSIFGNVDLWSVSPSVRLPMTNNLTFDMSMTYLHQDYDYAGGLTRLHGTLKGEIYNIGVRYYLPD